MNAKRLFNLRKYMSGECMSALRFFILIHASLKTRFMH